MGQTKIIARLSTVRAWCDQALETPNGIKIEGMTTAEAKVYRNQFNTLRKLDAELSASVGGPLSSKYDPLVFHIEEIEATVCPHCGRGAPGEYAIVSIVAGATFAIRDFKITKLDDKDATDLFTPEQLKETNPK